MGNQQKPPRTAITASTSLLFSCRRVTDYFLDILTWCWPHTPASDPAAYERRLTRTLPFDGSPRQRATDISVLIQEHLGLDHAFRTRDGSLVRLERFAEVGGYSVVQGRLYTADPVTEGFLAREADWFLDGSFSYAAHQWDLVSMDPPLTRRKHDAGPGNHEFAINHIHRSGGGDEAIASHPSDLLRV